MSIDSGHQWTGESSFPAGALGATVYTADVDSTAFDTSGVEHLEATLGVHAFLRTSMAGSNNDLDYIAREPGLAAAGTYATSFAGANNDLTFTEVDQSGDAESTVVRFIARDPSQTLTVRVNGSEIAIYLATDADGVVTSTSAQVKTAYDLVAAATALATVANSGGNSGAGVIDLGGNPKEVQGHIGSTVAGTDITVEHRVAGTATPLSVAVTGHDVVVNVATTSGGTASSTAAEVRTAVLGDSNASKLLVVNLQASNDGTGVVAATSASNLVASSWTGSSASVDVTLQTTFDKTNGPWDTVKAFSQKTQAATEQDVFGPLADWGRWHIDMGGGTPVLAISLRDVKETHSY